MYGEDKPRESSDLERTAFRQAEKKYKLYYDDSFESWKKKKQPKPVDVSDVLDFKAILSSFRLNEQLPPGIRALTGGFDAPVFCLVTSSDAESDCFESKGSDRRCKFLDENSAAPLRGNGGKAVSASVLLRKLRWSTLGLQLDWSKRNYDASLRHNKIPDELCELARRMAAPAMPKGEEFKPEAAIVNYFGLGDTLGGHLDDMEADWSKPIVSMSLGSKAIFLLGGKSRDDAPIAMFLRSGDIVLMAGEARECFHGYSPTKRMPRSILLNRIFYTKTANILWTILGVPGLTSTSDKSSDVSAVAFSRIRVFYSLSFIGFSLETAP